MASCIGVLLASMGFLVSISGMSITVDKSLIRSETKKAAIELHSSGEMGRANFSAMPMHGGRTRIDTCDLDYPVGTDECHCAESHHEFIIDSDECMEAAKESGATAPGPLSYWMVGKKTGDDYWQVRHPYGCFKVDCTESPIGVCYFFNTILVQPPFCRNEAMPDGKIPNVTGRPVCKRPKYRYGTADTNGEPDVGGVNQCEEAGYTRVDDENKCHVIAKCQGYRDDCKAMFVVDQTNESEYNNHPIGCFEEEHENSTTDLCANFNRPVNGYDALPSRPTGRPICEVTSPTSYHNMPVVNAGSTTHHVDHTVNDTAGQNTAATTHRGGR